MFLALAFVVTIVCGASAAEPVTVRLAAPPGVVVTGSLWAATLVVRPAGAGRPVLTARSDDASRTFAPAGAGRGRWRALVVLPTPGRWSLSARLRGRTHALGTVLATTPPAELVEPFSVALAPDGTLLVADRAGDRVVRIDPARGGSSPATVAALNEPIEVAAAPNGDVYIISDDRIHRVTGSAVTRVPGAGPKAPIALAFAPDGDLVVADYQSRVWRLDAATGRITTVIGNGSEGSSGDGGPAQDALVSHPHGVAVEADGSIVVADSWNHRVRRIDPNGIVATIPGGVLQQPIDVVVGPAGSLLVAGDDRVRQVARTGAVRTVAGGGFAPGSGDGGPATRARLLTPNSVAVAPDATLYVCEFEGRRVRRVDGRTGVITTVAR